MNYKNIYIAGVALALITFTGCNDYLDKIPDNRTELNSVEAVAELLTSAYPDASYMMFCETMSDNSGDKGNGGRHVQINEEAYYWSETFSSTGQDTPEFYWNASYEAIASSNQALKAIEELGSPNEAMPYKGEALLTRAYSHFMLVNLFAKTYNPATANDDMGIPFVTEPEDVVIKEYTRHSVAKVYELIQKDLEIGLPLIKDQAYEVPKYHFNVAAAYTFASRFYLYTGQWKKAIECANNALSVEPSKQMRDWTDEYAAYTYYELRARYTHSEESANLLLAGQVTWWGRQFASARYALTGARRDEIVYSDNVSGGDWAYKIYGSNELYLNIPKLEEHFKYNSINATTGRGYVMSPILTIEEALLNRAEALAMDNQMEAAVTDLNSFLSKRIKAYDASHVLTVDRVKTFYADDETVLNPFYTIADDQLPFVKCVADFKRVEYIHEGMRWFDVRRFRMEIEHNINNEVGDDGKEVLLAEDLRKECQIPELAIEFGLTPNPR